MQRRLIFSNFAQWFIKKFKYIDMISTQQIRYKYSMLDTSGRLITWIVVSSLFAWLFKFVFDPVYDLIVLPGFISDAIWQPWSYVTYGFVHSSFFHLLFNMMALHVVGTSILNITGRKTFLSLFFIGVILGGIGFSIATFFAPIYFSSAAIVGASAGVYAALFFLCFFMPDTQVRLFVWNIKLVYIAYVLLAVDVFGIVGRLNAGGSVAHLMGAGFGYFAAVRMREGIDVTTGFHNVIDFFENIFDGSMFQKKQTPLKTVYKNNAPRRPVATARKSTKQEQIDAILDKISNSGYESLSSSEKEVLFQAGKD